MFDTDPTLDLVEQALVDDPFCTFCSAATTIEDDGGRVWLTCSATPGPVGILARMTRAMPHTRRLVADHREHRAA